MPLMTEAQMKIRKRLVIVCIPVLAAILSVSGCQKKSTEKTKDNKALKQDQSAKAPKEEVSTASSVATSGSSQDGGVVMTEGEMERAQKRAEAFMKKHGPDIIERLANQQVRFFRTNLERGDALYADRKYKEAVAAYRDSLATKPNDARTLMLISRSALAASDLVTARTASLLGLHRAYDPRVRIGILELLGEIATKQGDDRLALFYYTTAEATRVSSLASPTNKALVKTIVKLRKSVKKPLPENQSFIGGQPAPLGPAPDLTSLCQEISRHIPKDTRGVSCDPGAAKKVKAPDGPFKEAAYLPVVSAETEEHYVLAGRNETGWFALAELAQVSKIVSLYSPGDKFQVTQFEFKQLVKGGPYELLIGFTHGVEDADPGINEVERRVAATLLICGQKESQLRCSHRIPTLLNRERAALSTGAEAVVKPKEHLGKLPIKESFAFSTDLSKPGKVIVSSKTPPAKKFQNLVGTINL